MTLVNRGEEALACPTCGGTVFEAEKVTPLVPELALVQVSEKGRVYHRRCFVCCRCRRPQEDKLQVKSESTLGGL